MVDSLMGGGLSLLNLSAATLPMKTNRRNRMREPAYTYRAKYVRNYDGDTVRLDIDLGFGVWIKNQSIRLLGIDTPELRGDEKDAGMKSKTFTEEMLKNADSIIVKTKKDKKGKYGRWIGTIYILKSGSASINLNDELVKAGMAIRKDY